MSGSLLSPGLVLKSMCVFKLCLECFHWGFLFRCLRRTSLGNIENFGDFTGEKSSGILEVDLAGKRLSKIETLAGVVP